MANSYKDIIITPNRSSSSADPKIEFRGANSSVNTAITIQTYPTSNGTISFEGSAGQLFSVTNDMTGSIYSVNDVSGIPSIEVFANGQINMAYYGGLVYMGGNMETLAAMRETKTTTSSSQINLNAGSYFTHTATGTTTFSVTNVPVSGKCVTFILEITNGGAYTINWWSGVKWPNGYAPALTSSGNDIIGFTTYDGGSTWKGFVLGYDVK